MNNIGIIGGSGLEDPKILHQAKEVNVNTPYGEPSSSFYTGKISGVDIVILSRHGRSHSIPPGHVNNRANLWALKELGCTHILATTACGSLRQEIGRGHLVFPDQFIDFTRHRIVTYFDKFEDGDLKHTPMADPFDEGLRRILIQSAITLGLEFHPAGTLITIEGPRFSTRAESKMFRMWGADVINMSIAPEAILANELKIPYAVIAMSTDYDAWNKDEEPVTWEEVLKVFEHNVHNVIELILKCIEQLK